MEEKHNQIMTNRIIAAAGVILLCAYIAFIINAADMRSLWYDDIVEINNVWHGLSLGEMLTRIRTLDNTPPLSYAVTWLWLRIAPYGDRWIKLPNIIFAVVAAFVCGSAVYRSTGKRTGAWMALICALSSRGVIVWGSYTARPYGLLVLVMSLVLFFYGRVRFGRDKKKRDIDLAGHILFAVCMILALYTHYFCVLAIAALGAFDLYLIVKKHYRVIMLIPYAVAGAAFLPWVLFVFKTTYERTKTFWPASPDIWSIFEYQTYIVGGTLIFWFFAAVFAGVWIKKLPSMPDNESECKKSWDLFPTVLAWQIFFVYGVMLVYSLFINPLGSLNVGRYFLCIAPASFMLIGIGAERVATVIRRTGLSPLYLAVLFVVVTGSIMFENSKDITSELIYVKEPYKETAEYFMQQPDIYDEDVAIFTSAPGRTDGWAYYLTRNGERPLKQPIYKENVNSVDDLAGIKKVYVADPLMDELTPEQLAMLQDNFTQTYSDIMHHIYVWER